MRTLLVILALGLLAVIHTPSDLFPFAVGSSAKSAPFYLLYAPFAWLPNGAGKPLGTAFALGLLLVAIVLPKKKPGQGKARGREGQ
jgi:hypothetical protein